MSQKEVARSGNGGGQQRLPKIRLNGSCIVLHSCSHLEQGINLSPA